MKIIQVIDLDGTTVKVDETNPSEPKIVAALQFDLGVRKNVAIGDIAELVFAKPTNANVEAVCIGYKGTDGKLYGIEDSLFTSGPHSEEPPTAASIKLEVPTDGGDMYMTVVTVGSERVDRTGANELYAGHNASDDVYVTMPNGTKYLFRVLTSTEEAGLYIYRCAEPYPDKLEDTQLRLGVSATAEVSTEDAQIVLNRVSATEFELKSTPTGLISTAFTNVSTL